MRIVCTKKKQKKNYRVCFINEVQPVKTGCVIALRKLVSKCLPKILEITLNKSQTAAHKSNEIFQLYAHYLMQICVHRNKNKFDH